MVLVQFWVRFLAIVAMSVWLGGFMFYGGVVVAILERALGRLDAGTITRDVTDVLNGIGVVTVAVWWVMLGIERRDSTRACRLARTGALTFSSLSLLALLILHVLMDHHLDRHGLDGFRPWHRGYLMTSTAGWVANLACVGLSLRIWTPGPPVAIGRPCQERHHRALP
ncbi:MAG: hypothetical protein JWN86_4552 [Planctomycetota bacterium]|nr:hypothetical protein [Planctomycetota bacterium]